MGIFFGGLSVLDPKTIWHNCRECVPPLPVDKWWGKCNIFRLPLGVEAGTGAILLSQQDYFSLDTTQFYDLVFSSQDNTQIAPQTVTLKNLVITKATAITPSADGSDPAIAYFVEIADKRQTARAVINKAYNLRDANGNYLSGTEDSGPTPWTWTNMVTDIWNMISVLGSFPGMPSSPDGVPENFQYYAMSAMDALGDVFRRLAYRLRYDPTLDTFSIVQIGNADAAEAAAEVAYFSASKQTWDIFPNDPNKAWLPDHVAVQFWRLPQPTDGSSPYYTITKADPSPQSGESGTIVIQDDLTALGASGTPSNDIACQSRATERAADFYRVCHAWTRMDKVFGGTIPEQAFIPGSMNKWLVYEDRGQGLKTEIGRPYGLTEILWPGPIRTLDLDTTGTVTGQTVNLNTPQVNSLATASNTIIQWGAESTTGTVLTAANDTALGTGGTFNNVDIASSAGSRYILNYCALTVTYGITGGRIDLYLCQRTKGFPLTESVIAASTIDIPTADLGEPVVLSCSGIATYTSGGADNQVYLRLYNDTAHTITFGDADRVTGNSQANFLTSFVVGFG